MHLLLFSYCSFSEGSWNTKQQFNLFFLCSWVRASWINVNNCPTRREYIQFYYIFCSQLYMIRMIPSSSSGAHSNCNYNIWQWSNRIYHHPLTWRSGSNSSTSTDSSKYSSASARCCNYSLRVLLMMGEVIIRKCTAVCRNIDFMWIYL
jgi:hypothetical protein